MSIPQFKHEINQSQITQRFSWMHNNELLRVDGEESQASNIEILPT